MVWPFNRADANQQQGISLEEQAELAEYSDIDIPRTVAELDYESWVEASGGHDPREIIERSYNLAAHERSLHYSEVHTSSYIGKFITPLGDSWAEHLETVLEGDLQFNPLTYSKFDGIIVEALEGHLPQIYDDKHRHYADCEPLRNNIAVMRNYVYNHFFPDGSFDEKSDGNKLIMVEQIALEVGDMLRRGAQIVPDVLNPTVSLSKANQVALGGAEIYNELRGINLKYNTMRPLHAIREIFGSRYPRNWNLPPIDMTPFGRINMREEPADYNFVDQDYVDPIALEEMVPAQDYEALLQNEELLAASALSSVAAMDDISDELGEVGAQLNNVADLQNTVKERAVKIAHDILDKLRVEFADMPIVQLLDNATMPIVQELFSGISKVADTYKHHLDIATRLDPDLMNDMIVLEANDALGVFSYQAKLQAVSQAEMQALAAQARGDDMSATELRARAEQFVQQAKDMPDAWKQESNLTVADLLDKIEAGLDKVVDRVQDITQSQNSLGVANALELSLQPSNGGVEAPGASNSQEENKDTHKVDQKFDAALVAREAMLKRQADRKAEFDRKTGRDKKGSEEKSRETTRKGQKNKLRVRPPGQQKPPTELHTKLNKIDMADFAGLKQSMAMAEKMEMNEDVAPNSPSRAVKTTLKNANTARQADRSANVTERNNENQSTAVANFMKDRSGKGR